MLQIKYLHIVLHLYDKILRHWFCGIPILKIPPLRLISLRDIKKKRGVLNLTKLYAEVNLFNKAKLIVKNLFLNRVFVLFFLCFFASLMKVLYHCFDMTTIPRKLFLKKAFNDILNELALVEGLDSRLLAQRRFGNNSYVTYYEYMITGVTRRGKRKLSVAESVAEVAESVADVLDSDE